MSSSVTERLISRFHMLPHPEGGWYSETYRSELSIHVARWTDSGESDAVKESNANASQAESSSHVSRSACTVCYFLLSQTDEQHFSQWHRLRSDEILLYHLGAGVVARMIDPEGNLTTRVLANPLLTTSTAPASDSDVDKDTAAGSREFSEPVLEISVPHGTWLSMELLPAATEQDDSYCLISCVMAPGWDTSDFTLGTSQTIPHTLRDMPHLKNVIPRFIRHD